MSIMKSTDRRINPEARLYGAMFGAIWLPIGLFIYSFTQYGYIPWVYLPFTNSFIRSALCAHLITIKIKRNTYPIPCTTSSE